MKLKSLFTNRNLLIIFLIIVAIVVWQLSKSKVPIKPPEEKPPETKIADRAFGPIPTPLLEEVASTSTNPTRQTSNFENIVLPETAAVYKQTNSPLTTQTGIDYANQFGHPNPTIQGENVVAEQQGNFIMVIPENDFIVVKQPFPLTQIPQSEAAIQSLSQELLSPILRSTPLWQNPVTKTNFYDSETAHDTQLATRQTASLIVTHFFPTIDGFRIINKNNLPLGQIGPAKVEFNLAHQSTSIAAYNPNLDLQTAGIYPLKTLAQVIEDVQNKNTIVATIIPLGETHYNYDYGQPLTATSAEFNHIELVYFYDADPNGFLQPIFLISGRAELTNGKVAIIRSAVSAIAP